jgi:hypothetical protein
MRRMARVVYLHVGAPKTGTTYLQDRLAINREELERHGVSYPIGTLPDMFLPALDLIDLSWGGQREGARGEWEALMSRVRRAKGAAVLSHEILAGATSEQVRAARADLRDTELHLVYSARDLARQIPAEWQEQLKHRHRRSFARFLARVQREDRRTVRMWFWRVQGLPDVLTRWSSGLPPERVHLVTVPPDGAPKGELWRRYCQALAIDPSWAPLDSERRNVSLGAAESTMLRSLNRRLRTAGMESSRYREIVRGLVVHEHLAKRPGMAKVTLPPEAFPWARQVAEEWLEWVRGAGIDVVGEPDDLMPRPPEDGARWVDPDRPRAAQVADAALDALVAVVMELAERPGPGSEEHPGRRVVRAARRRLVQ